MKTYKVSSATVFALMSTLLWGCGRETPELTSETRQTVHAVRSQDVVSGARMAMEDVIGTVNPKLRMTLSAKTSGMIVEMRVVPGQVVTSGTVLVALDDHESQARVAQAQATVGVAQKDRDRFKTLLAQQTVTQQEYDATELRFQTAVAQLSEAVAIRGYTQLVAPFDGVVTAKHVDVGDLATVGKALIEMEDPAVLRFDADVPESLRKRITLNDTLQVHVAATDHPVSATVTEIAPVSDPVTRTFSAKLALPVTPDLRAGQFGRVMIPLEEVHAIYVPADVVVVRGQMEMVFIVVQQHAVMRLVKTGQRLGGDVEILSGLAPGERVVVMGAEKLMDGDAVEVSP